MIKVLKENTFIIFIILLIILFTKIIESISIISFAPILDFYTNKSTFSNKESFLNINNFYNNLFDNVTLLKLILFTSFLFLFKNLFQFISKLSIVFFSYNISRVLMVNMYNRLIEADWLVFNKLNTEKISNTLNIEIEKFALLLEDYFELVLNITSIFAFTSICFYLSWELTLTSIILFSLFFIPNFFIETYIKKKSDRVLQSKNEIFGLVNETLKLFKNIQIFFLHNKYLNFFTIKTSIWYNNMKSLGFLKSLNNLYIEPSIILILGLILFLSNDYFYIEISKLFIFLFFFKRISDSIKNLINNRNNIKSYSPSINQFEEIYESLIKFKNGKKIIKNLNSNIEFKNIDFYYNKKKIFNNLSFTIKRNTVNIILAPSGFGKTTIINLLLGLLKINKGKININNNDIRSYDLKSWRKRLSVVTQDLQFSNTSILEFAKLINPYINNKTLQKQLKTFKLNIQKNIKLGSYNVPISGGEQQRLRIAIAVVNNPDVLIFDEPTSSIDKENKDIVISEILKACKNRTAIIVTHDNYLKRNLEKIRNTNTIKL